MPNFLSGLVNALPYAAAPLAQTIAAQNQADLAAKARTRQNAMEDIAVKRQADQDKLNTLIRIAPIGGRVLPAGTDPNAAITKASDYNDMVSGANAAIPNSALGIREDQTPNAYGKPSAVTVGDQSILIDPSQSNEALSARRQASVLAAQDQREASKEAAALQRETQAQKVAHDAATRAAQADYDLLPAAHPLKQVPFNEDYAKTYAGEVAAQRQKALQASAYHAPPAEWEETPSTGPNGRVILMNKVTGERKEADQGTPKAAPANAQNQASDALLKSSVAEMNNGDAGMRPYEEKLRNGTANISGLSQFMGSVANTFTHDDPVSKAAQTAALTALNNVNPDLARYIRQGLAFAEGESGISKRPSDFRTRMAAFLSTAASGAGGGQLDDIQRRRRTMLDALNTATGQPNTPGGGRAGASGGSPALTPAQVQRAKADPEYAQFLRETGKGVPPTGVPSHTDSLQAGAAAERIKSSNGGLSLSDALRSPSLTDGAKELLKTLVQP